MDIVGVQDRVRVRQVGHFNYEMISIGVSVLVSE